MIKITNDVKYVGVDDLDIDLFEGQYVVPDGVSYNSYVCMDDKIAIFDTVDKRKTEEWLKNLEDMLADKKPDYLIISHMEPDHSASIISLVQKYPKITLVGNDKTFSFVDKFFGELEVKKLSVKDGDKLSLGSHCLKFVFAPMVHWPEVMFVYDETDNILFSADAFGKFGALSKDDEWDCEARRYYFNIVGKYGAMVQSVLKKIEPLNIKTICPLHGPVLLDDLSYYIEKYKTWSSYVPEDKGIIIAYASIYGNTEKAVKILAHKLEVFGEKIVVSDLARSDMAEVIEDAFRYNRLVLASVTLDGGLMPVVETFINKLKAKNYQNRTVAFIENGTWAPVSARLMKAQFETMKDIKFVENNCTIQSVVNNEVENKLEILAQELNKSF